MKPINLKIIQKIVGGKLKLGHFKSISQVVYDTRTIVSGIDCLFIAIVTDKNDGHKFIQDAYAKGVRNFMVSKSKFCQYKDSNILLVDNTMNALQIWAVNKRKELNCKVIGVTGSYGKTIVKEWLYILLNKIYKVYRSPKSYNSQLGVPLSIIQTQDNVEIAIYEVGISKPNEMIKQQAMVLPDLCVLTNIGQAHSYNFKNFGHHLGEKLILSKYSSKLVYCRDNIQVDEFIRSQISNYTQLTTWGKQKENQISIREVNLINSNSKILFNCNEIEYTIDFPYQDKASIDNLMCCIATCVSLGVKIEKVIDSFPHLPTVSMRLEFLEGINGCTILNDCYTTDIDTLKIALETLSRQPNENKAVIISDILNSGIQANILYKIVSQLLIKYGIKHLITIGDESSQLTKNFVGISKSFSSTNEFIYSKYFQNFMKECVLVKGARPFNFEKIVTQLEQKSHDTIFEVNLNALISNLNIFRSKINKQTKVMCMVKAHSYGLGSIEIAKTLQAEGVDMLAVAYVDEGIILRQNGIYLPIMVMNVSLEGYSQCLEYNLEPEIYSIESLKIWTSILEGYPAKMHLKIETGMNRLGFTETELVNDFIPWIKRHSNLKTASVFTHLSSSDRQGDKEFTKQQIYLLESCIQHLKNNIDQNFIVHVLNSSGIINYPEYQFDMIRIGLGLFGYDITGVISHKLKIVGTLRSIVCQIKNIKAGESVGYGRSFKADREMRIAVVPIGYADGLHRKYSEVGGNFYINGDFAKIVGSICMDFTVIDVTDINCKIGDYVEIFGKKKSILEISDSLGTIPYELLSQLSSRIKRVYLYE